MRQSGRRNASRSPRTLAGACTRRPRLRALRPDRDRPSRGAPTDGARDPNRSRPRARTPGLARRRARDPRCRASLPRGPARPADARSLPKRPSGRGARDISARSADVQRGARDRARPASAGAGGSDPSPRFVARGASPGGAAGPRRGVDRDGPAAAAIPGRAGLSRSPPRSSSRSWPPLLRPLATLRAAHPSPSCSRATPSQSSILERTRSSARFPSAGDRQGPPSGKGLSGSAIATTTRSLRIDPRSLDVVRTIGLGVAPTDVEVGAGSVWVLSDRALLRVDPAINDVVATVPLPRGSGQGLVPSGGRRECGFRLQLLRPARARHPHRPRHEVRRVRAQKSRLDDRVRRRRAVGDHRLGAEHHRTDRPEDERRRRDHSARGASARPMAGAIAWPLAKVPSGCRPLRHCGGSIPRQRASRGAFGSAIAGKAALATGDGAIWVANSEGMVLRVDPDSQTVARRFRSGLSSTRPTPGMHLRLARDRSGLRSRRLLRDDRR